MFVTAAYAVICLDSGTLTYANAGHCLPMLRPASGPLRTLPRGGMALGVLPGLTYEEHSIALAPGDRLVFYSDGVTEVFSPQGAIFGEERLLQLLESSPDDTAQALLDAILASVYGFCGAEALTDDLTLLVLRRTAG
jgi:sigma-B regulation protein RsbU (phosphoserine phosphatase)